MVPFTQNEFSSEMNVSKDVFIQEKATPMFHPQVTSSEGQTLFSECTLACLSKFPLEKLSCGQCHPSQSNFSFSSLRKLAAPEN